MMNFVLIGFSLGKIRDSMICALIGQFAQAVVKSVVKETQTQRQEVVKSYQTTCMKPKTFTSEMLRHDAPIDQIVNTLVEEGCGLLKGTLYFEAQVNIDGCIWGKRSVRTNVFSRKEGQKELKYLQENDPSTSNVPRNFFEKHTVVAVKQDGEYEVCTIATNFPEVHQYTDKHDLWESVVRHCGDYLDFKLNWASISEAQMRIIYRNSLRQKQHIEKSQSHVEEKPKNERQIQQCIHPEPTIVPNRYDAVGRNFHFGSIGIGVVALFFTFATIWWLNNETKKEEKV